MWHRGGGKYYHIVHEILWISGAFASSGGFVTTSAAYGAWRVVEQVCLTASARIDPLDFDGRAGPQYSRDCR